MFRKLSKVDKKKRAKLADSGHGREKVENEADWAAKVGEGRKDPFNHDKAGKRIQVDSDLFSKHFPFNSLTFCSSLHRPRSSVLSQCFLFTL